MLEQHGKIVKSAWTKKKCCDITALRHAKPAIAPVTPEVTQDITHKVRNIAHNGTYVTPKVRNVTPDVTHVAPDVTHVTPDVTHVTPDVTHVTPDVTHVIPNITHSTPDITYVTPMTTYYSADGKPALNETDLMDVKSNMETTFQFRHPFTMILAGPTSCGKTTWLKKLLHQAECMITPVPRQIFWFYKRWQPMYTEMQENIPNIKFVHGIRRQDPDGQPAINIYDDLMKDSTNNSDICEMYTEGSHHCNLSVICLLQNLYYHGKENRTMSLSTQYMVLFKNPRDQQQVVQLPRQMYPNNWQLFLKAFHYATKEPYGYLLVDLKQDTADKNRLKTNVIKVADKNKLLHSQTGCQQDNIMDRQGLENNKMDKHHCLCIDCGIMFASPMDLQKHVKRGCPENEEPAAKRFYPASSDESEDESGWNDIVQQVYDRYDDNYSQKVKTYENDGYSNLEARQKATEDLFQKYKRGIIKNDMLKTMNSLKHSMIHLEVTQQLQNLK